MSKRDYDTDNLAPARGVGNGLLFSLLLYCLIAGCIIRVLT